MLIKRALSQLKVCHHISRSSFLIESQHRTMASLGSEKFGLPNRYKESTESVWVEYVNLALKYKPLNLGQGFPDYPPPSYVTQALSDVANGDHLFNQYTRGFGHPRLVNALSKVYSQYTNRNIDPINEVRRKFYSLKN
jgi:kynurenine--oxoglutarate transaminase/cysteine-S-conjugate beta-lyase/glutamine--phenylpyruvate transaminase